MRCEAPIAPAANDWETTTLGEICREGGGDVQTGPFGSQLHAADYVDDGVPVIMPQDIVDGRIDTTDIARIGEADAERLARYQVRAGDIVYSRRGDLRRRVSIRRTQEGWLCGTGCLRVRVGGGAVRNYLAAYLGHPAVQAWIERHAVGATMPNLNTSILSAVPVLLPSLPEQRRIASILAALDDKIDSNRRLAKLLEETAAAIFKARFVDFVGVEEFEESEIGRVPRGWSVAPVEAIAELNARSHTTNVHPDEIGYVDISSVGPREVRQIKRCAFLDAPSRARRIVQAGDTIISTVRPERRAMAFLHDADPGLTVSTGFVVVTATKVAPTYLYRLVTSDVCIDRLAGAASGSAYPAVNPAVLASWIVPIPPDAGRGYEVIARPIETLRDCVARESRTLASLRDALLPKLISGQMRVPDTEDPAEVIGPAAEVASQQPFVADARSA